VIRVVHLIDRTVPADLIGQLSLLAGAEEQIVSLGPAPQGAEGISICPVRRAADWRTWYLRRPGDLAGKVAHAWSVSAFRIAALSCREGDGLVLSLPTIPPAGLSPFLRRAVIKKRAIITAATHWARDRLLQDGMPAERVAVLPPAVRPIAEKPARRALVRAKLGLSEGDRLLVAPGSLSRFGGGGKQACWVFAILRQFLDRLRLLIPGSGPAEPHVRLFAASTGYGEDILFAPELGLEDALASADAAFFLPERGVGLWPLASAMAAGLPIVASGTAELAECTGESALLVQPADRRQVAQATWKLLSDRELAAGLGGAAERRAAALFAPGRCRQRLEEIYAAALGIIDEPIMVSI